MDTPATSEPSTALTVQQRASVALGAAKHEKKLVELAKQSTEIVVITNAAGLQQCHAARMTLKNERINIEKLGKAARDDATRFSKAVIEEERRLIGLIEPEELRLQALQDAHTAEIERKKEEVAAAERERIAHIQAGIRDIRGALIDVAGRGSAAIEEKIRELVALDLTDAQEFKGEAEAARELTLERLRDMHGKALEQEAQAKRLQDEREALDRQREAQEAEQRRREEEDAARQQHAEAQQMAMSEINGIQQQVIIAQMGRAGVRRGGTIACIEETLAETEAWPIDRQRFGEFTGTATEVKDSVVAAIRALLTTARAQEAEAKRFQEAQDKLDADRRALEERQHQDRLAEERRQHDEAIARETREREEREARELAEHQAREVLAGENRAVDEIARVERDTREAQQRELARVNAEKLDIREALNVLRKRADGLDEFAWFVTAFDRNAMPKQARRKAAATA